VTCRYGDEQHLDEALNRIWAFGRAGNPPRKLCPKLVGLREEVVDVSDMSCTCLRGGVHRLKQASEDRMQ